MVLKDHVIRRGYNSGNYCNAISPEMSQKVTFEKKLHQGVKHESHNLNDIILQTH